LFAILQNQRVLVPRCTGRPLASAPRAGEQRAAARTGSTAQAGAGTERHAQLRRCARTHTGTGLRVTVTGERTRQKAKEKGKEKMYVPGRSEVSAR